MLTSGWRISSKSTVNSTLTITILENYAHQVSQLVRIFKHQVQWPHFGIHNLALFNTNRESIKKEITEKNFIYYIKSTEEPLITKTSTLIICFPFNECSIIDS